MERAGRGRKARWVPGSCSAPPRPHRSPGVRWSIPVPGPRLLWAKSAVTADSDRSGAAGSCVPVATALRHALTTALPPLCCLRSMSYLRPLPHVHSVWTRPCGERTAPLGVPHSGACVRLCSACASLPSRSLAGEVGLCGSVTCTCTASTPGFV